MKCILLLFISLISQLQSNAQLVSRDTDCKVCERIMLFDNIRQNAGKTSWPSFAVKQLHVPLIYFSDSNTYVAYSKNFPFKDLSYKQITCKGGFTIFKMSIRLDSVPFHMENKMVFNDTTSPYYFRPMMFCSDVEAMIRKVPDFKTTEEWLQLVMHEYFHSFQFSHYKNIHYFAKKVHIQEDSLTRFYKINPWFSSGLKTENSLLLSAINTTHRDSAMFFLRAFVKARAIRRKKFKQLYNYNISADENFWEKTEGTARYMEYYTAFAYTAYSKNYQSHSCDTLFNNFLNYKTNPGLRNDHNFVIRTQIMPAYYYVTGFNMCRLLDKLHIDYKTQLFELPYSNLTDILAKKLKIKNF